MHRRLASSHGNAAHHRRRRLHRLEPRSLRARPHRRPPRRRRQADLRGQPAEPRRTRSTIRASRSSRPTSPIAARWRACSREHRPRAVAQPRRRDARRSVDRRSRAPFVETNIVGTFVLLEAARALSSRRSTPAARERVPLPARLDRRGVRHARRRRARSARTTPYAPNSPYAASKAAADHLVRAYHHTYGLPTLDHQLLEQLRAVSVPGEADPADDPERARGPAAADLRRRRQRARLAARRGSLRRHPAACCERGRPGEKYNIGGGNERTNLEIVDRICATRSSELRPGARTRRCGARLASYATLEDVRRRRPGPRPPLRDRRDEDPARARLGAAARLRRAACATPCAGTSSTATGATRCRRALRSRAARARP